MYIKNAAVTAGNFRTIRKYKEKIMCYLFVMIRLKCEFDKVGILIEMSERDLDKN